MAENSNSQCRKCRNAGVKLFLKGDRCFTQKCPLIKRNYAPGEHGQKRKSRPSEYSIQLAEKQKAKAIYGLSETQMKNIFLKASKTKTATGEKILQLLECRLDNLVYRLGMSKSRGEARQMVRHKKILVNNQSVSFGNYLVSPGEIISPKNVKDFKLNRSEIPSWLELDKKTLEGKITALPKREDIQSDVDEQLIVEYYSR